MSIVSCKFKTNKVCQIICTYTPSNAIVNAASNISYRSLLEASDTRSMLQADVFAVPFMNEVKNLTNVVIGKLGILAHKQTVLTTVLFYFINYNIIIAQVRYIIIEINEIASFVSIVLYLIHNH